MPGKCDELAHLLETDLGFATDDQAADEGAGRGQPQLWLDLVCDAEAIEQAEDIVAAGAGGIADGAGCQQSGDQGGGRADIGPGRASAHGDANAGRGEIGAAAGLERAGGEEGIDVVAGHNQEIESFAGGDALLHVDGPGEAGRDFVPCCSLEIR